MRVYTKGRMHAKAYIFDYAAMYDLLGNKVERTKMEWPLSAHRT